MLDLVIRRATVVDGTGAERRVADIGVHDGRIVEVGTVDEAAARSVDGSGLVAAPGFIDIHTHYDAQGFWDPALTPSPFHGVTTIIGGNCGFSIAPVDDGTADYIMRMLARVEGIPLESLQQGVPWNWQTVDEYFDRLDGRLALNAGFMAGHSAIRRGVMREAANERTATENEIAAMQTALREALAAGCLGFSSSRGAVHTDGDSRPVPSRFASVDEILTLSAVISEYDGTTLEMIPEVFNEDEIEIMAAMSIAAGRALNWNVMYPSSGTLDECLDRLRMSRQGAERGSNVFGLATPLPRISLRSFLTGFVFDAFPGWRDAMSLPPDEKLRVLRDPAERKRLYDLSQQPNPLRFQAEWPQMLIVEAFGPDTKPFEGRVVGDIAVEQRKTPFDALLDIACADGLRTLFRNYTPEDTVDDWQARVDVMRDPRTITGGSDAGAHLDMLSTFTYTTSLLENVVRKEELMTVEEVVHLLTQVPARLYGLHERGTIEVGKAADLVLFDSDTVGPKPVETRFDLPGGAGRLYGEAYGVEQVIVNGTSIVSEGALTGETPGTLLRSGRDTRS